MTKVKFSGIIADMRGKLNGSIFSASLSGNTMRTKAVPINRLTQPLSVSRSSLQQRSQEWRDLTQAERDAWNTEAPNFPQVDIFGDPYFIAGFNLYGLINMNRVLFGVGVTVTAPGPETVGAFTLLSVTITTGADTMTFVFTPTPMVANTPFLLYATRQLSPGIGSGNSRFRLIRSYAVGTTSPQDFTTDYKAIFPADLQAGRKIFIYVTPYDDRSYQGGVTFFASTIIT